MGHIIHPVWRNEKFRCKRQPFNNSHLLNSLFYYGIILFELWDQSAAKRCCCYLTDKWLA